jgi:hypothetical protein
VQDAGAELAPFQESRGYAVSGTSLACLLHGNLTGRGHTASADIRDERPALGHEGRTLPAVPPADGTPKPRRAASGARSLVCERAKRWRI